jgi:hypothetical protein
MLQAIRAALGHQTAEQVAPACERVVSRWASMRPTGLSRRDLAYSCSEPASRLEFGRFLRQELKIRFAQRAQFFQGLPYGLVDCPGIQGILRRQKSYIARLESCPPPETPRLDFAFTRLVEQIQEEQQYFETDLFTSFRGLSAPPEVQPHLDEILHHAVGSRVGTKVLMAHHTKSARTPDSSRVGVVDLHCRPGDVARLAARQCATVCRQELGEAPEVLVQEEDGVSYALIPGYLLYILREVIKNACHATVKRHVGSPLPPVVVRVAHHGSGATISVSDEAGGMTEARLQDAWRFLHTTAEPKCVAATAGDSDEPAGSGTELAGFGVGLPKSRLYARFFGDDLALDSVPGEGTQARLTIRGDGGCRSEIGFGAVVPRFNILC